jgi:hypothetical protein
MKHKPQHQHTFKSFKEAFTSLGTFLFDECDSIEPWQLLPAEHVKIPYKQAAAHLHGEQLILVARNLSRKLRYEVSPTQSCVATALQEWDVKKQKDLGA